MSERKKEIFKENSINKNSPCPNAPSSCNGELEVRRNLSNVSATKPYQDKVVQKNKLYSAIGINQKLFKQKPLENKKTSVPKPTERDLLLLETLESYGVLSTQQIRELIFKDINTRTVLRRLRLLKQRGFIYSSEGLPNGALAWVLSKKSALLFKHDIETKIINKNTLQHDVAVSSIRIQLERLKIVESWTSEHILKKEVIKSHYKERRNSLSYMDEPPIVPDSLFIIKHEGYRSYWRLAVFMLSTGVRVSEACGLKWEEINLEENIARIIRRVRWDHFTRRPEIEDVTKTDQSSRLIMFPEKLKNVLKEMKEEDKSDFVFTDSKGELLKYNAIQSAFNASFTALNLPWRSTHICRHTYATITLMTTKNISAVQASLGHTEIRMTQKYAKTIALLSSETGEKTFSALFKDSQL